MTELLRRDAAGIARAAALLRQGRLVAFGTETVYGLGADATNPLALAGIFTAKGRPRFNPLIIHFPDAESAFRQVAANAAAQILAAALWPGPLTLVLSRRPECTVDLLAGAGLDTLAVRVPSDETARALLAACGVPVAAPSANRSGAVSPTTAAHVLADLQGRIDAVLDAGPARVGLESTVLDLSSAQPTLLRPGGIPVQAIEALIGPVIRATDAANAPRSPGQLLSHYAPRLPLHLNATNADATEALLAFGPNPPDAPVSFNLSETGDVTEAATRLFTGLRTLDAAGTRLGLTGIAAMKIPAIGLGEAINDRLTRAARPREIAFGDRGALPLDPKLESDGTGP